MSFYFARSVCNQLQSQQDVNIMKIMLSVMIGYDNLSSDIPAVKCTNNFNKCYR